jgi:hypothetical protein
VIIYWAKRNHFHFGFLKYYFVSSSYRAEWLIGSLLKYRQGYAVLDFSVGMNLFPSPHRQHPRRVFLGTVKLGFFQKRG